MNNVTSHKKLPEESILLKDWNSYDYLECYSVPLKSPETVDSVLTRFFSVLNSRTKKHTIRSTNSNESNVYYPLGSKAVLFEVLDRTDWEIVQGEGSKTLMFRTSVLVKTIENRPMMYSATAVKFQNGWGRVYFFFVKPFHRLFLRILLKRF